MIIDLEKFIKTGKPYWEELEAILARVERHPDACMTLKEVERFHYLYERVSADLGRICTFSSEREIRAYLETLVARAYGEIHETRRMPHRFSLFRWLTRTFPATFRAHIRPFYLAVTVTLAGVLFGALVPMLDPSARDILMPFDNLLENPSDRVAHEEKNLTSDHLRGLKAQGAAFYITNNTRVALFTAALGATYGVGTLVMLLATGIMLGAVAVDYVVAGQTKFLVAWLLPHGSVEIPAILLAAQAGFVLAGALVGWKNRVPLRQRLRQVAPDFLTLLCGVALMLAWAGIIEAFLSQYHEPVLPYSFKIAFGAVQLILLMVFLARAGREKKGAAPT